MASATPRFLCDYPALSDDFWDSLEYTTCRNFLECFSKQEIQQIPFDRSMLQTEKLELLLSLLQQKLSVSRADAFPLTIYEADYVIWSKLMLGLATVHGALGNTAEQISLVQEMVDRNKDRSNLSSMHYLSSLKEKQGRYEEAEALARKVLPWLDNHPLLGRDSPQSLGSRRILLAAVWKQGREEEARNLIQESFELIEETGNKKFEKYQREEKELMEKTVAELETWKLEERLKSRGKTNVEDHTITVDTTKT